MCSPNQVCCFVCFKLFRKDAAGKDQCQVCGDFKCPHCHGCLCSLSVGEQKVALAMMKTYEPLLSDRYKFSKHSEIEEKVKKSLNR